MSKRTTRTYTLEERREAFEHLDRVGDIVQAAEELDIPQSTLRTWQRRREELLTELAELTGAYGSGPQGAITNVPSVSVCAPEIVGGSDVVEDTFEPLDRSETESEPEFEVADLEHVPGQPAPAGGLGLAGGGIKKFEPVERPQSDAEPLPEDPSSVTQRWPWMENNAPIWHGR